MKVGAVAPYIFVANGISSLYAYEYSKLYPDEIQKLVVIDGIYPTSILDNSMKEEIKALITNSKITFFAEFTGYARILSYVKEDIFHIDQMKEMGFPENDIKTYRKMIANRYYTGTMRREIAKLEDNMKSLENYIYPDYLPVTQIFSSKNTKNLTSHAEKLITNKEIQDIITIEGNEHNLSLDNPDAVIEAIKN